MIVKDWLVLLRYPNPKDLEIYLERKANEGYFLKPLSEKSLFYYSFEEGISKKAIYIVDCSSMPRNLYIKYMIDSEWEYLGQSGNCYIWRKIYEDARPENITNKSCRRTHCLVFGIGAAVISLILLALIIGLIWGYFYSLKISPEEGKKIGYFVEAALNVPFAMYFAWSAKKLLS